MNYINDSIPMSRYVREFADLIRGEDLYLLKGRHASH